MSSPARRPADRGHPSPLTVATRPADRGHPSPGHLQYEEEQISGTLRTWTRWPGW
ncbi:MAG: hypothetical protein ACLP5E_20965 [Streptosporangiaceae bacterium]